MRGPRPPSSWRTPAPPLALPGLLGNAAHRETDERWQEAKRYFDAARRIEQQSLRADERVRAIASTMPSVPLTSSARHAPHRSVVCFFLREHPGTRRWIEQLEERVTVREHELARAEAAERQVTRDGRAKRVPRRGRSKRSRLEASPAGDAATRAVLERAVETRSGISGGADAAAAADRAGRDRASGGRAGASDLPPSTPTRPRKRLS